MALSQELLIYGTGGFAREVAWLAQTSVERFSIVGYIDDDVNAPPALGGVQVQSLDAAARRAPGAGFVAAVGKPATRRRLVESAIRAGLVPVVLTHQSVERSSSVVIGDGSVICAGSILTVDIVLGSYVQINLDCTIGHDCVLEEYATLAPGVHMSGNVRLEMEAYVGTGACIINGTAGNPIVIGRQAIIGAGAVVTKSVPPGVTVVGIPARERD